jgi:hypothetical protein
MSNFQTKNPNLGKFPRVLEWINSGVIWSILQPFVIFCFEEAKFVVIWYITTCFGMFYREKSGNWQLDWIGPEYVLRTRNLCILGDPAYFRV